ncbi:hypothetical protein DI005_13050 [Prauserella sp. PE36]|uniref:Uncharacterized protein n=1 Tax=Prauserella endophytica TaxID=1592324 RepID=A0ABY2RZV6_9PSEU|nr:MULTISPECIES: hypothetical protein [Prauserella]RBM20287.1 hypothetical protein DI005_13050 [Prauserella sp. PE36]TKG66701.1 hypothetical protein FCN18_24895 [Prauserella endophytica]
MLYFVLILVLAALGLVVTALITANSLWAWISIGLSVLAGLLLVVDWLRRRAAARAQSPADAEPDAEGDEPGEKDAERETTDEPTEEGQTALLPATGELKTVAGEPAEEQTDAADLLVVSALETEVLVVDEYPRYHLGGCTWLESKDTIPLPVKEARDLGFTPCALCTPDATLAAEHREKRESRK